MGSNGSVVEKLLHFWGLNRHPHSHFHHANIYHYFISMPSCLGFYEHLSFPPFDERFVGTLAPWGCLKLQVWNWSFQSTCGKRELALKSGCYRYMEHLGGKPTVTCFAKTERKANWMKDTKKCGQIFPFVNSWFHMYQFFMEKNQCLWSHVMSSWLWKSETPAMAVDAFSVKLCDLGLNICFKRSSKKIQGILDDFV